MQYLGLIAFFVLFLMGNAYPANWKAAEKVRQGNNLYQEKKYDKALEKYNAAQEGKPESPEIQFNMADVFYRQGKYNEAADSYNKALEHGKRFGAKTHYNIGNALFRQGRFQEALDAYKRSLEINPNDLDTKYNIEFTQQKMKEMLSQAKETENKAMKERQERKQKGQEQGAQSGQEPKQESAETTQKGEPNQSGERQSNQKDKGQAPKPGELSREAAERMLGALEEEEKSLPRNLELNKKQMQEQGVEKDW